MLQERRRFPRIAPGRLRLDRLLVGDGATGRRILDDLRVLGHVHIADSSWRVTPPVLSLLSDGGGNGLFVGARPAWLVRAMDDLDNHPSRDLQALADHVFDNTRVEQKGPSSWYFSCGPEAPLEAMEEVGVRVVNDLAGAALRTLVQRGPDRVLRTVRPGEIHARITSSGSPLSAGLTWEPANGDGTYGMYCYLRNGRRVFAERASDGWWEQDFLWAAWGTIPRPCANSLVCAELSTLVCPSSIEAACGGGAHSRASDRQVAARGS